MSYPVPLYLGIPLAIFLLTVTVLFALLIIAILRDKLPMSNRRRLKPPPTGFSYARLLDVVLESDLPYEQKREILMLARKADRKGRLHDGGIPQVRELPGRGPGTGNIQHRG